MSKKRVHRLFIYGTLKKDHYFHNKYLGEGKSNFLGSAVTTKHFSLYIDALPNMVKEDSETGVKGELYEVDEDVLKSLDELEGHPVIYFREIIDCIDENGEKVLAWAYLRHLNFIGKKWAVKEYEFV